MPKEGLAAIILGKPKKKPKEEDDDSGRKDAAEEVLAAIKSDDIDAFDDALSAYVDICTSGSGDYDED